MKSFSALEKENVAGTLHEKIFGADKKSSKDAIKSFMYFDLLCSFLYIADEDIKKFMSKTELLTNVAKYFLHYFKHHLRS